VSAPELTLATCRADILEIAACGAAAGELAQRARDAGCTLPPLGHSQISAAALALAVRPQRCLLLLAAAADGVNVAAWQRRCAGAGVVVELSAALAAFVVRGSAAREVLRRGCRLDLDPKAFPAGAATATSMAQVAVTLAALPAGLLLLTPASTARHFEEWLDGAARGFGMTRAGDVTVAAMCGARDS
jgi:heterotetrameric sarcosine oxidase gamma subunit